MEAIEKQPDQPNVLGLIVIGLSGAFLVYVSFIGLQAFYEVEYATLAAEREAEDISLAYDTLHGEQEAKLEGYRWLDQSQGRVSLPIDQAMARVVETAHAQPGAVLVPAVGPHDTPTVPAAAGRPPDGVQPPPAPAPTESAEAGAAPAEGSAEGAEGTAEAGTAPAEGAAAPAEAGATPAEGASAPAAGTPAAAPAAPASAGGDAPQ
ncbi:hypothetical protein [Haliangium sp.]|uniref:hypothetical protein n=1 Tax=Haliangium sp. TaxID=2663208 RepID=UPI003D0C1277